jgi:hypothetical protein
MYFLNYHLYFQVISLKIEIRLKLFQNSEVLWQ